MTVHFDSIKRGLLEAIEHAEGRAPQTRMHRPRPVDVKALRAKVSMTQEQFAARLGVTFATINRWENGHVKPSPLALRQIGNLAREVALPGAEELGGTGR